MVVCTNCSETVEPVVAVDIDGTLAEYHDPLHAFATLYLGRGPRADAIAYVGDRPHREWFCDVYEVTIERYRAIKLAYRQGANKRFQPINPGARRLMVALSRRAEVWVTTTRPFYQLDNIDPDTRFWLDRHNVPYRYLLSDDDKYQELHRRVDPERVVAVIEDLPEQYDEAARLFGEEVPIMMGGIHNLAEPRPRRLDNLDEAAGMVVARIQQWRRTHHA